MRPGIAALVALLSGFAVMSLELTAVRLLAPHFGDSAYVWTNVIGVMLVALAAGAWIGGRLAHAVRAPRRLFVVFTISATLTAIVPLVAGPLGGWLLPQDLLLDDATPALVRGSLFATTLLFAPPVALIGTLTPMLVVSLVHAEVPVGRASGLVAAASTIGSLIGTFATTHLLVPELGSRATIWVCAAMLLVCGGLVGRGRAVVVAALIPLGMCWVPLGALRPVVAGTELLAEVESPYQYLRVERAGAAGERRTELKINEGLDSFHSVALEGSRFTGAYYDYHAAVPFLVGDGKAPQPLHVLSLGAAAGTFARVFDAAHPGCRVDGVELDGAVVALGEEYFGGRPGGGRVFSDVDARVFVERARERYSVVLVDAYERQVYIPAHVASRQFFAAVERVLVDGGIVSVNVGGLTTDDPVVEVLAGTMAAVFGEAWLFRVPRSRNFVAVARKGRPLSPEVLAKVEVTDPEFAVVVAKVARAAAWHRVGPGAMVLDDDRPFLDRLQDAAVVARGAGGEDLTRFAGTRDAAVVAGDVQATVFETPQRALATLATAATATADLRLLAGHARWLLRDLGGACREYEAGLALAEEGAVAEQLRGSLAACREDQRPAVHAAAIASRNSWLAIIAWGAMLAAFVVVDRRLAARSVRAGREL